MTLFDSLRRNAEAIRRIGVEAIDEAKRLGVPSHYVDPVVGEGIVREWPDGTRQRLRRQNGSVSIEPVDPRR
ncbi:MULTISPECIES: hypothetical protein [Methylorubrum]|jgi:hypothetical protein|uniref:Uncharacterized protein n=2 Tax=Methylorubrum TaxID=2282523 RepID=A0A833J3F2_9HYPH|nr:MULTISPECIES: hypothetical protein [Methylorubrum]KAB7783369.1 hypothetical protein F8B43_4663 [Methylorubrum populi]MBA8913308.1 hypothetical protein [Methylorubrum thiocyanatum]GJE80426.1 hypothetical protein CJNNKLLH_1761 [Methylorubrum thiocyanatum]